MLTADGPKLIEYNVRFGDPETQVLMMRLKDDLLVLLEAAADGQLAHMSTRWRDDAALTVVMAAENYPGTPRTGTEIRGLTDNPSDDRASDDLQVFHAGTALRDGRLVANGGRVLNVTAMAPGVSEAARKAYAEIDRIDWPEGFCRRDIGWREIEREKAR